MCCPQFTLNLEEDYDPGTFGGSKTSRKCTDLFGLLIMLIISGTIIGLTSYCVSNSQIEKIENGYDECGNICGKNNINTTSNSIQCFGVNMKIMQFAKIQDFGPLFPIAKECVYKCHRKLQYSKYCVSDTKMLPLSWYIWNYPFVIVVGWVTPVLIMWGIHSFLKETDSTRTTITSVLVISLVVFWAIIGIMSRLKLPKFSTITPPICAIITIWILSTLLFLCTRNMERKIHLTEILTSEVYKINDDLSLLIWPPIVASIAVTVFFMCIIYCIIYIDTFSYLKQFNEPNALVPDVDYVTYPIASVTQILLIFAFLLFYEFVKNFQCMLVGGCVAQWYFTRRNSEPTFMNQILEYHLGTICWGSILLALTFPARFILNGIIWAFSITCKQWCCANIRLSLSKASCLICFGLFSRSGFTMTAIHGCSFCAGTIRAHKLLAHNPFNAIALYTFADWYLGFHKFFGWICSFTIEVIILAVARRQLAITLLILYVAVTILSYFVMDLFIGVFETTKDTLVLCFCEDCLYNDGASSSYYMDPEYAQFVEHANKFIDPIGWELISDDWNNGPKRLY